MRLSVRFVLPLLVTLGLIAYAVTPLVDGMMQRWFTRDLDMRARLVTMTLRDALVPLLTAGPASRIVPILNEATRDERLMAIGYCDKGEALLYPTEQFPRELSCPSAVSAVGRGRSVLGLRSGPVHVAVLPVDEADPAMGHLVLVHDLSFAQKRTAETRFYLFAFFIVLGVLISALTVLIAQMSWRGWVASVRAILSGQAVPKPVPVTYAAEYAPIIQEVRDLVRDLQTRHRMRDECLVSWGPKTLKELLNRELAGEEILTVSNREPYIHTRRPDGQVEVQFPASGLVSALEPVMRACSGVWIAHGSGSADREFVDARDRVPVPPESPAYTLRRVWLSQEEEQGYYYGFANEGLWPLCHIAHLRPVFRKADWEQYVRVNERFADAIAEEARTEDPIVLVQDYHFALLPRMVRERVPQATIITFWHIPWPNPEAFSICPWREALLEGLLGSTVLGFHIQFHCNNFIDTVDRFLESRIDREHSTITYGGEVTAVNPYPISIEWPSRWLEGLPPVPECRRRVRERNGLPADVAVGVGVDRLDYTKGIVERLAAVERLLELHPEWIGRFCFIQVSAPSRSSIPAYQRFTEEVAQLAACINGRFAGHGCPPIQLRTVHHPPRQVFEYYRGADLCFVSSLHDGMNLVAKEFIAARDDEAGVLVLSLFTGASRELPEALVVNPYDTDQCAQALHRALTMPASEQRERMRSMRGFLQEFNIFRWAGRMLLDAARIRKRERLLSRVSQLDAKTEAQAALSSTGPTTGPSPGKGAASRILPLRRRS